MNPTLKLVVCCVFRTHYDIVIKYDKIQWFKVTKKFLFFLVKQCGPASE